MNETTVRIAVCMKDRAARQLVCNMFSSAGATIQVCADTAALTAAADTIRAIVLGLGAAPEETFDALVTLRQRSATLPIYVIPDAAGERHAKRATAFGATHVVPHEILQRRVGHLVQEAAQASGSAQWDVRSPGWAAGKSDPGYEIQSMDLGAWLAVPANRRLLGMEEPYAEGTKPPATPQDGSAHPAERPGADPTPTAPAPASPPPVSAAAWVRAQAAASPVAPPPPVAPGAGPGVAPWPGPEVWSPPAGGEDGAACNLTDCPLLVHCRAQHDAQNAAILEAHVQRDQRLQELNHKFRERLQADLRNELYQVIGQQGVDGGGTVQERIDATAAALRRDLAAALRRIKLLVGTLIGLVVLVGAGLAWRLGGW